MELEVRGTGVIGRVTGAGAHEDTAQLWDVHGTDLGHMFWHRGQLYMVFGDTFGKGGRGGRNWRSNTMARLAPPNLAKGDALRIESMVTGQDGKALELLPSQKVDGIEKTVIPTNGISTGDRMVLHYMSVRKWLGKGNWDVAHSGLAYSDDDGASWTLPEASIWAGGSGFEQVAFVDHDGFVYSFGIPGGRYGGVRLRRVAPERILEPGAYRYWDGAGWVEDPGASATVVPAPVGELSVEWNGRYRRWMMMYLDPERRAVVMRMSPELTGPWGPERVITTADEHPGLYAPFIVPLPDIGSDVWFTMSLWDPYNVFLLRTQLVEPTPIHPGK